MARRGAVGAAAALQSQIPEAPLKDAWGGVHRGPGRERVSAPSVADLSAKPDEYVRFLKERGVHRLCELRTSDHDIFSIFRGKPFLTVGSDHANVECAEFWADHLGLASLEEVGGSASTSRVLEEEEEAELGPLGAPHGGDEEQPLVSAGRLFAGGAKQRAPSPAVPRLWGIVRTLVRGGGGAAGGSGRGSLGRSFTRSSRDPTPPEWAHSVQLEAFVVAVRDAAAPGKAGLIQPLLRRFQAQACSYAVFGLPAVQAVISHKWGLFARRLLLVNLAIYLVWLFAFLGFMTYFEAEDGALTLQQLLSTQRGRLCVGLELLALCGMAPFVVSEAVSVWTYKWGWLSSWNLLDLVTYSLQITITSLHVGHFTVGTGAALSASLPLLLGIQCILLFIRLQFFSRCFRGTAFDFLGSLQAVLKECWWYICVMLLLVLGFAGAFWVTFRDADQPQFSTLPLAALTMLNWAVGGASYYLQDLLTSAHPNVATALCIIYQFVVSMIMMSLLIGVLTTALAKSTATEDLKFHLSRAEIIDELETIMPRYLLRRLDLPRYIHVLRINPNSIGRIESQYLWQPPGHEASPPGTDAGSAGGGGGGGSGGERQLSHGSRGAMSFSASEPTLRQEGRDHELVPAAGLASEVAALQGRLGDMEGKMDGLARMLKQVLDGQRGALPASS